MNERFAVLEDLTRQEGEDARTRVFTGAGSPFLPVAGLQSVEHIRIGAMLLPLLEIRLYPIDSQMRTEQVEEPLISLQKRSDGTPVLIRSTLSNDGIWPKGVNIYVTGEWDDAPSSASAPAAGGDVAQSQGAQVAALETDAVVRVKVADETHQAQALANEGLAPVIVDPVAGLHNPHDPNSIVPDRVLDAGDDLTDVNLSEVNLSADVLEKVRGLGTLDEALVATNEQFNAVGITGLAITRVRNALKKVASSG